MLPAEKTRPPRAPGNQLRTQAGKYPGPDGGNHQNRKIIQKCRCTGDKQRRRHLPRGLSPSRRTRSAPKKFLFSSGFLSAHMMKNARMPPDKL